MVLIVSETGDITTDKVIDWLLKFGQKNIIRINDGTPIYVKSINIGHPNTEVLLSVNGIDFSVDEVSFFWYRRGLMKFDINFDLDFDLFGEDYKKIYNFHNNEWLPIRYFIIKKLEEKPNIGNYHKTLTNKLQNIECALSCGLKVPQTYISQYSKNIREIISKKNDFICKPVSEFLYIEDEINEYSTYTRKINREDLKDDAIFCSPQLIQEYIEKWIELRVFVLKEKFFSMAIFSQNNTETNIDYRDVRYNKRPRVTPFILPKILESKLLLFMKKAGYNTGSIDLIVNKKGEFFFLEINPIGVIDMVSYPCNYHIEKEIAKYIVTSLNS